jgi:hypothetical protein
MGSFNSKDRKDQRLLTTLNTTIDGWMDMASNTEAIFNSTTQIGFMRFISCASLAVCGEKG